MSDNVVDPNQEMMVNELSKWTAWKEDENDNSAFRAKLWAELPSDWNESYRHYFVAWFHLVLYFGIFGSAFALQNILVTGKPNAQLQSILSKAVSFANSNLSTSQITQKHLSATIVYGLCSPLIGWSVCGVSMCGHDAMHNAFAPNRRKIGKLINTIVTFLGMDCILQSTKLITVNHNYHHRNAGDGTDLDAEMVQKGNNVLTEMRHVLFVYAKWQVRDVVKFLNPLTLRLSDWLAKPSILAAMALRWSLFFGFNGAKAGACNLWCFAVCFNYIVFFPHRRPVRSKPKNSDYFKHEMQETWDFFPGSQTASFFLCGLGMHLTHHVFPFMPRALAPIAARALRKEFTEDYRSIESIGQMCSYFWNRHTDD